MLGDRLLQTGRQQHPVVLLAAQLLRPADADGGDEVVRQLGERVADNRRVVLAVDDRDRPG
jgi:hypothetical protein